jgi:pimeloyl-ACP methyl ester carboxylesterase
VPFFERDEARLYYEIHGDGFPVLLLAPGGMSSSIPVWENAAYNAIERLAPRYKVIAMDQRNAGQSTAPITGADGWRDYRDDQIALLDHLGVDRFHAVGMCIGGSFIMGLAETIPERLASAVMLQPIGFDDNRKTFYELFDGWAEELRPAHPSAGEDEWAAFRSAMFGGEFLFNVSEDVVSDCQIPLLVLMGEDVYHPESTSRRVAELAPRATLIERWKEGDDAASASTAIDRFLAAQA